MQVQVRQTGPDDYPMLVDWWNHYKFPPPDLEFLPDNGNCGLMIEGIEGCYCAGFIYETNAKVCLVELIVMNPDIKDKEVRKELLLLLIAELSNLAREWGYKWIFTSVQHPSLIDRYIDCGYQKGATGTTEMIKQL